MPHHFAYHDGVLHAERVSLDDIANRFGTPCFVYSRAAIEARYRAIDASLSGVAHRVCYAVKANSNLAVLNVLARLGAGFDIVSGGELERVLAAGAPAERVVFSGVGKRRDELAAALAHRVHCFNVESAQELEVLADVAASAGAVAPVSLRVNPDVDPKTHPYISTGLEQSKFGVPFEDAEALYVRAAELASLDVRGVDCHIGSQLSDPGPLLDALDRLLALVARLRERGITLSHIDVGGGMGIAYAGDDPVPGPEVFNGSVAVQTAASPSACDMRSSGRPRAERRPPSA